MKSLNLTNQIRNQKFAKALYNVSSVVQFLSLSMASCSGTIQMKATEPYTFLEYCLLCYTRQL